MVYRDLAGREIYPDDAARQGYQLVLAAEAEAMRIGDLIPVGTGYDLVPLDDARPGLVLGETKAVSRRWGRVERIGEPSEMTESEGHYDDARSARGDGFVCTSVRTVMVCRVYFREAAGSEVRG